jgi:hypothetical protein
LPILANHVQKNAKTQKEGEKERERESATPFVSFPFSLRPVLEIVQKPSSAIHPSNIE